MKSYHMKLTLLLLMLSLCHSAYTAPQNTAVNPFAPSRTLVSSKQVISSTIQPLSAAVPIVKRTETYFLSFAHACELQKTLQPLFSDKLGADPLTNSIILQASESEHKRLQQLLKSLDKATNQVTLEAKIIALSQEDSKNLGINWNWDTIPQKESSTSDESNKNSNNFGGNFKFWRGYSFRFNATLNALISNGKARILAKPRIITIPGKEASIFIGDHIPVQTEKHDSSGTYTATEYLDAGIKLQYTPIISSDAKMVTASVHTEVSTPILISELHNYRITSRKADTNVRMFSGETLVIGGLINEEEQQTLQKIPFLSDIPILGKLFTNRSKKRSNTEVILLLTPHITSAGTSPAIYSQAIK